MPKVRLTKDYPVFLVSEFLSSDDTNEICLTLTSREVTIIRSALFPVCEWPTRLGERVGNRFEYTEDEEIRGQFKEAVSLLDYKLSGEYMASCLENLITAISEQTEVLRSLQMSCSQQVNCGGGGGGCGGGGNTATIIAPTAESVSEGTPPDGMEIIPQGDGGKCNRINYLIDWIGAAIHDMSTMGVGQAIQTGVYVVLSALGFIATKNPLIAYQLYKVMGYFEGIVSFFAQQIDLAKMDDVFNDVEVKKLLVCAWYEAEEYDVVGGNAAMADILSSQGFTTSEIGLVSAIGGVVAFACIWYQETGSYSIYEEMTSYTGGVGCGDCALGNVVAGYPGGLVEDYGLIEQAAEFFPGWACGENAREIAVLFSRPVNVEDIDIISGTISPCSPSALGYTFYLNGEEVHNSDTPPTLPIVCDQVYLLSASDFTADILISEVV